MVDLNEEMLCLQDFDETEADIYRLNGPKVPWGDYGSILVHGMTNSTARDVHPPEIQRTGPFVPPISFPGLGCIVVTTPVRDDLESAGLSGLAFVPAIKKVVVSVDWHEWDLFADQPQIFPDEGEPENYILEGEHSEELARRMPDLWRLVIAEGATEVREPPAGAITPTNPGHVAVRAGSWKGADFFRADTTLHNYVSPRARQWLIDRYPAWITFKPGSTK